MKQKTFLTVTDAPDTTE